MVAIDATGVRSIRFAEADPKLCLFEFVYFARPDTQLYGQSVHARAPAHGRGARAPGAGRRRHGDAGPRVGHPRRAGLRARVRHPVRRRLREEPLRRPHVHPAEPEAARHRACASSSTRCRENIKGKRLVVVDDSIVRGTTTRQIIAMLREAGAAEVHFRVSSPPYRWPCFYGLDTGKRSELLAADMSVGEIPDYLGVDSLAYLELDRLDRGDRLAGRVVLHRVLHRRLPGAGARPRHEARARGRDAGRLHVSGAHRSTRVTRRPMSARPTTRLDLRRRRRRHRRRREGRRAHQGARALDVPARGRRRHRRLRRAVRRRLEALPRPAARVVDRRRRHEVADRPARRPARHDRHRLRRDVGRRHRRAGRRAAVLPRLHLDRQARPRGDRRDRRRRRRRLPRRRGCALLGGEMSEHPDVHGAGRVRPRRLRGRRRRAGRACCRATCAPGDRIIGLASPGLRCNGYSLARAALLDRARPRPRRAPRGPARTTRSPTSCCGRA